MKSLSMILFFTLISFIARAQYENYSVHKEVTVDFPNEPKKGEKESKGVGYGCETTNAVLVVAVVDYENAREGASEGNFKMFLKGMLKKLPASTKVVSEKMVTRFDRKCYSVKLKFKEKVKGFKYCELFILPVSDSVVCFFGFTNDKVSVPVAKFFNSIKVTNN